MKHEAFNYPVLIQEAEEGDNQVTKGVVFASTQGGGELSRYT